MRSRFPNRSLLARFTAPVLASIALHGVFVVGIWQLPTTQTISSADADPTLAPTENDCTLRLDDAPRPLRAATAQKKPRADGSIQQASFDVHLVESPSAPAPLPTTLIASPSLTNPGVGSSAPSPVGSADGTGSGGGFGALEVARSARSVVYVIDRSISMGFHGALARARREVLASLRGLSPSTRFQVIAYNREAEPLRINGQTGLLGADADTLRQVTEAVSGLRAGGSTDHGRALRRAVAFHPDLIYFLTDADDLSLDDVKTVTRLAGRRTIINAVELNGLRIQRVDGPLHRLAADNGGAYLRINPEE